MARALDEKPSNVMSWKKVGRVPAEKQPLVLERAARLNLDVTADDVVYPLGRPPVEPELPVGPAASEVACERPSKMKAARA